MRLLPVILLTTLVGCGGEVVPTAPVPEPSPTPTPQAVVCEALRADIFAELNKRPVSAWNLGEVPTLTASVTYRGDQLGLDTSDCESLTVVTWIKPQPPQPFCELQGNTNSPRVRLQCYEAGFITVRAIPQGFTILPAEANFKVQGG